MISLSCKIRRMLWTRSNFFAAFQIGCMTIIFMVVMVLATKLSFGSIRSGKAWITGQQIFVDNTFIEQNFDDSELFKELRFLISNFGREPIAILGSQNSCSCTLIQELPESIPIGGSVVIVAVVGIDPKQAGSVIEGNIRVFTGLKKSQEILLQYRLIPLKSETSKTSNHNSRAS